VCVCVSSFLEIIFTHTHQKLPKTTRIQ